MNSSKGYYSLIQYCPDLGRLEAANIGVLVFCPERAFLKAKMVSNNSRIIRFFGAEGHDWARINSFKRGIEERLAKESREIRTFDDLQRFIALRSNLIQISQPRPMKVSDPESDLDQLFQELIGATERRRSQQGLRRMIQEKFDKAGLQSKIRNDIQLRVPILKKDVEIPFGYQNGRFNLLTPVQFGSKDSDQSVAKACKYAVEGQSLNETPHADLGALHFCVVGQFRPQDKETLGRVRTVLEKYDVKLYRADQMAVLIDEIRRTGKDIVSSEGATQI